MKNMIGKTVLLERLHKDGKSLDYSCGEYLVINQSPMTLYCVKYGTDSVYQFHDLKSFLMEGTKAWKVVKECDTPAKELSWFINNIQNKITSELAKEKRNYVESVYHSAQQNINSFKREMQLID